MMKTAPLVEFPSERSSEPLHVANQASHRPSSAHPSSGTDGWCTPRWLAEALGPFDLDPCSNAKSHVRARETCSLDGLSPACTGLNGLTRVWVGSIYVNPPYSDVGPWAVSLAAHEGPWVALVKLDPTTRWWATLMTAAPTVAPFRKRIKFESDNGKDMTANFASVLIYSAWRPPTVLRPHLWLSTYEVAP